LLRVTQSDAGLRWLRATV